MMGLRGSASTAAATTTAGPASLPSLTTPHLPVFIESAAAAVEPTRVLPASPLLAQPSSPPISAATTAAASLIPTAATASLTWWDFPSLGRWREARRMNAAAASCVPAAAPPPVEEVPDWELEMDLVRVSVYTVDTTKMWGLTRWHYNRVLHTAVELNGTEWAYCPFRGVFKLEPRSQPGVVFRESIVLGPLCLRQTAAKVLLNSLCVEYVNYRYDPIWRNANIFTASLGQLLAGVPVPEHLRTSCGIEVVPAFPEPDHQWPSYVADQIQQCVTRYTTNAAAATNWDPSPEAALLALPPPLSASSSRPLPSPPPHQPSASAEPRRSTGRHRPPILKKAMAFLGKLFCCRGSAGMVRENDRQQPATPSL